MSDEDPKYRDAVKRLPCASCQRPPPSECHHHRHAGAGMGKKAHDHLGMPMCLRCHHDFHGVCGPFRGYSRAMLTEWQDKQVGLTWRLIKGTFDGCPLLPVVVPVDSVDAELASTATSFVRHQLTKTGVVGDDGFGWCWHGVGDAHPSSEPCPEEPSDAF